MCGRFTLKTPSSEIAAQLGGIAIPGGVLPRFCIAPSQKCLVVRETTGERTSALLTWGLRPSWMKPGARMPDPINARSETIAEKPMFRSAYRKRRCLVPADGFYEWSRSGKAKIPWYFRFADDSVFTFAGIWEHWGEGDVAIETFALVTTEANDILRPIHDRSPVIIAPVNRDEWLDEHASLDRITGLLTPFPSESLAAHEVSRRVNNPRFDNSECISTA